MIWTSRRRSHTVRCDLGDWGIKMDLKETFDFLLQPRRTSYEIWRKSLKRQELESCLLPTAITYDKDQVQTSPDDQVSRIMAEVADLDRQIQELRQNQASQILEVSEMIEQLDDPREVTILSAYFVGRISVREIAERLNYSIQHIYDLRSRGVDKIRKIRNGSVI